MIGCPVRHELTSWLQSNLRSLGCVGTLTSWIRGDIGQLPYRSPARLLVAVFVEISPGEPVNDAGYSQFLRSSTNGCLITFLLNCSGLYLYILSHSISCSAVRPVHLNLPSISSPYPLIPSDHIVAKSYEYSNGSVPSLSWPVYAIEKSSEIKPLWHLRDLKLV